MYVGRLNDLRTLSGTTTATAPTPTSKPPAQLANIPNGFEGMRATLGVMRDFARAAVANPEQIVRTQAEQLTRGLPPRQWFAEIRALHEFVRDQIRYLRDPVNMERVATPEMTLQIGQGDCDDKATLLAAMLDSIGHPTRYVALAFNGEGFSHVLVETKVRNTGNDRADWMPLETILPDKEMGWYPAGNPRRYILKV